MPGTDKTKGKGLGKSKAAMEKEFALALQAAEKGERLVASTTGKGGKEEKPGHAQSAEEYWAAARGGRKK